MKKCMMMAMLFFSNVSFGGYQGTVSQVQKGSDVGICKDACKCMGECCCVWAECMTSIFVILSISSILIETSLPEKLNDNPSHIKLPKARPLMD